MIKIWEWGGRMSLVIDVPRWVVMSRVWPWGWVMPARLGQSILTQVKLGRIVLINRN